MAYLGRLVAWLEPQADGKVTAAFVGSGALDDPRQEAPRGPATRICASTEHAVAWIEGEATAIGVEVAMLKGRPVELAT